MRPPTRDRSTRKPPVGCHDNRRYGTDSFDSSSHFFFLLNSVFFLSYTKNLIESSKKMAPLSNSVLNFLKIKKGENLLSESNDCAFFFRKKLIAFGVGRGAVKWPLDCSAAVFFGRSVGCHLCRQFTQLREERSVTDCRIFKKKNFILCFSICF